VESLQSENVFLGCKNKKKLLKSFIVKGNKVFTHIYGKFIIGDLE
jgi:hypothetical protein